MALIYAPNVTTDTQPSPGLWGHLTADRDAWATLFEDFNSFDQTVDLGGTFMVFNSGSGTAALQTDQVGGVIRLTNQATDNDEMTLVSGDNTAGFCKFTAGKRLIFEARVALGSITDAACGLFAGLAEEALGGALFTTGDVMESKDYVGWRVLTADGDQAEPAYLTAAGTEVVVKADAQTLVATTFYKLGFYCDGVDVQFFVNGVPITGCDVAHPVPIDTSGFPDGEEMAAYVSLQSADGAANTLDCDWIKVAYER